MEIGSDRHGGNKQQRLGRTRLIKQRRGVRRTPAWTGLDRPGPARDFPRCHDDRVRKRKGGEDDGKQRGGREEFWF